MSLSATNGAKLNDNSIMNISKAGTPPEGKFISFFTMINIANLQCQVGTQYGFCVTDTECTDFGGAVIGDCARGYGTCCYKTITCGESTSMNVTYIQNSDYPSATTSSGNCFHQIYRQSNVCQLRLDFENFELSGPNNARTTDDGKCLNDQMTVSNVASPQFKYLCGKMPSTWHFYLDVRDVPTSDPTVFNFFMDSAVTQSRTWRIRVTQVSCDLRIPGGCGHYFTGNAGGDIYSFNWDNGETLYGLNYDICFRREKAYCTYSFVDEGPSWIMCPDTLAFQHINNEQLDVTGGLGTDTRDCNLQVIANTWRSPMTTYNYGPLTIYYYTNQDYPARNLPKAGLVVGTPGFHFSWTTTC